MTDSFVQCAHWCVYIRESVTPSAGSAPPLNEVSFLSPSSSSSSCGFTPAASLQTSAKGHCVTLLLLVNDTLSPPNSARLPGENDASSGEAEPSLCGRDVDNVFSTINHNQENLLYVYAHSFPYSTVKRYRKWRLLPAHTFTQLDTAPHTHPSHFLRPLLGHICRRSS